MGLLDYKYRQLTIEEWDSKGFYSDTTKNLVLDDMLRYPNNSIVHKTTYEKLLNNIHRIPINELSELVDKYAI